MGDDLKIMDKSPESEYIGIGEGFRGQRVFFSPRELQDSLAQHPMAVGLQAVHMGWFPSARNHAVVREEGAPEAVMIFCRSGAGRCCAAGIREVILPGQVLFLPPGVPHRYAADPSDPWSIYWVHFAGTVVPPLFAQLPLGSHVLSLSSEAIGEVTGFFRRVLKLLDAGHTLRSALAASHYLRAIIGCCFFVGHGPVGRRQDAGHDFSKVIRLMQDRTDRSVDLLELARYAGLSRSRFSALFRERTGLSPVNYHTLLRMQSACQMLDSTKLCIHEIAGNCGYTDPYHFSRQFKRVTGVSPSAYRKAEKG